MALRAISLFAGVGGLDLACAEAIGARTVCYVERESQAAAVLVEAMEQGRLDSAPVWSDITTFGASRWRGKVDCIIGGFPCQDLSVAGQRAGIDGERSGLWSEFARVIREVRPWYVFVENVSGLLANEPMRRVLGDLAEMGFDAEWGTVRASDAGAPHRRERVFILAYSKGERRAAGLVAREDMEHHRPQPTYRGASGGMERPAWPPGPADDWSGIPPEFWPVVGDPEG